LAYYDRDLCCLRMWQPSLLDDLGLMSSLARLPGSGSMRSGCVYERPTSALPTGATGGSLLPTPSASNPNDGESPGSWQARNDRLRALGINGNGMGTPLAVALRLLPTPDATHGRETTRTSPLLPGAVTELLKTPTAQLAVNGGSQHPDKRRAGGHGPTLADQVEHLLPTPSVADGTGGHLTRSGDRSSELLLPGVAKAATEGRLLPTPTAMDSHGARNATAGRSSPKPSTNSDGWTLSDVFWTGESTSPRSAGGRPSSDGPLPRQLSLDEAAGQD